MSRRKVRKSNNNLKKVSGILVGILLGTLICYLGYTNYSYKKQLEGVKFGNVGNSREDSAKVYGNVLEKIDSKTALEEKINCYKTSVKESDLPSSVSNKINELTKLFKSDSQYFSFLYKDIESGFVVSYNENGQIFTASTIKAPAMIYLYEKAAKGEIDLDEKLTYTSNFYSGGTGILKNKKVNTSYTVRELIEYTIRYSDNIGYAMLMKRYGQKNMYNYWTNLGTKAIFKSSSIWGNISASDASIYMQRLYDFALEDEKYGTELMEYFKTTTWKVISNKNKEFNTANKSGWSNNAFHDVAIVFEENPYILVILSNKGNGNYNSLFSRANVLVGELHEEYWKYKESVCGKIKQY